MTNFNEDEHAYVRNGGNLWYVAACDHEKWCVFRCSLKGHVQVSEPHSLKSAAEALVFRLIKPSSFRTVARVHHAIGPDLQCPAGAVP